MNHKLFVTAVIAAFAMQASANNHLGTEPLKLETPELKAELVEVKTPSSSELSLNIASADMSTTKNAGAWKPDISFFKSRTNPGVKPYKFMDDMTFVGIPLFAAGWALKSEKAMFRVNQKAEKGGKANTQLLSDFKTGIDDYLQFFGPAAVVGLKLGGYEGRSDWPRLLASAALSYGIMAGFVNGIKYTAKEMRPDGSTANSWPSGHTATAFVGATLLHKEYGLTRSPWFSVAGYGAATATGVMRVLNNRHWVSDVMSGAGLGILSTELGYAIGDLLFKGKGLLRNDLEMDFVNPSFFSISMGVGLGSKDLEFSEDGHSESIKFRPSTVVDAEGAYFFNKYIGVGGRLRVRAMSAKSFGMFSDRIQEEHIDLWEGIQELYMGTHPGDGNEDLYTFLENMGYDTTSEEAFNSSAPVTDLYGVVKSDHLTEFTGSVGLYFNIPLSKRFALGTKALIGRSFTQELDIDGYATGNKKDIEYNYTVKNEKGQADIVPVSLAYPSNTGETWTDEWEYLTVGAKSSTSFGTGISLTYKYKSNFSWRLFCDYDYTKKDFTMRYDPFHFAQKGLTEAAYSLMELGSNYAEYMSPVEVKKTKKMNFFTLGLSFLVNI